MKAWLYKIATNVCLDMIGEKRRARPVEDGPQGTPNDELMTQPRGHWLEPVPDAWALPRDADPSELLVLRQSIRLAFVAALQHLAPKQRATLRRSGARGPVSESRLRTLDDGRYEYLAKKGTAFTLTAEAPVRRLVALLPPPRRHLTSFHGVFAPNVSPPRARTSRHGSPCPSRRTAPISTSSATASC